MSERVAVGVSQTPQLEPGMAKSVAISQLIGAVLFALGSACFVWMAWADEWVLPWRVGCALWIGGCVPYLWPPLINERYGTGMHVSNVLQVLAMLSWAVGSGYAFHDNVDVGMDVNCAAYLAGSACLLVDALLQSRQLCSATRDEQASLLADLLAGVFYTLAGGFAGYASPTWLIRAGNCFWLAGSLFSGVRPCLALCADARGGHAAKPAKEAPVEALTASSAV